MSIATPNQSNHENAQQQLLHELEPFYQASHALRSRRNAQLQNLRLGLPRWFLQRAAPRLVSLRNLDCLLNTLASQQLISSTSGPAPVLTVRRRPPPPDREFLRFCSLAEGTQNTAEVAKVLTEHGITR